MRKSKNLFEPENMIMLYAQGAFPMADEDGNLDWYFPEVRTIIPIDNFNIPRSLKKFLEKSDFEFRFDTCTMEVVRNCARRETTWISEELITAYKKIMEKGFLHSVEVFRNNLLVGGLYGVSFGSAFFGESMFSKVSQASKAALAILLQRLKDKNFTLLDVQYKTNHLEMFGAIEITLEEYQKMLINSYSKRLNFV